MSGSPDQARHRRRFADTSGFTLIEVLVAFTVMATLLSVLYRGVVTMRAGSLAFDDHTQEEILARAILEDALARRGLEPGSLTGIREGRRWTLVVKSIDLSNQLPPPQPEEPTSRPGAATGSSQAAEPVPPKNDSGPRWSLQRLVVRVATNGEPLEIETIRIAKAAPSPSERGL